MAFFAKNIGFVCAGAFGLLILGVVFLLPAPKTEDAADANVTLQQAAQVSLSEDNLKEHREKVQAPSVTAARPVTQESLQGNRALASLDESSRQELLAQLAEIDRFEMEMAELQESEELDESSFGIVADEAAEEVY